MYSITQGYTYASSDFRLVGTLINSVFSQNVRVPHHAEVFNVSWFFLVFIVRQVNTAEVAVCVVVSNVEKI